MGHSHVVPVGFRYNAELDTIDFGGHRFSKRKKFRDVLSNPWVAFVVDDLASVRPWIVRGIEIRQGRSPRPVVRRSGPATTRDVPDPFEPACELGTGGLVRRFAWEPKEPAVVRLERSVGIRYTTCRLPPESQSSTHFST